MTILVKINQSRDVQTWADYVRAHPLGTLYHLSGWKSVIEKTYGHKTYYLLAGSSSKPNAQSSKANFLKGNQLNAESITGILPLVHFKNMFFGNSLISIPFFDLGGILADDEEAETALLNEAVKLAQKLGTNNIEIRNAKPLSYIKGSSKRKTQSSRDITMRNELSVLNWGSHTLSNKVRMLLDLPDSSEELMKSFKSKLRSQIKKPIKEGLTSQIGGLELLDDFYKVFSINMRDLGSPVHSKKLIRNVLTEFPNDAKLVLIYKEQEPVAGSVIVGFKDTLENPWASSLRKYSKLAPNMLLYWAMLEYACDKGFKNFDFGRSSPDGGTYKFKKQWGARPELLHWQYISLDGQPVDTNISERSSFEFAANVWKKLPVPVANVIGPRIRKNIGL
jgi:FemAB-related protein (PEP-CTERM system-associated)